MFNPWLERLGYRKGREGGKGKRFCNDTAKFFTLNPGG